MRIVWGIIAIVIATARSVVAAPSIPGRFNGNGTVSLSIVWKNSTYRHTIKPTMVKPISIKLTYTNGMARYNITTTSKSIIVKPIFFDEGKNSTHDAPTRSSQPWNASTKANYTRKLSVNLGHKFAMGKPISVKPMRKANGSTGFNITITSPNKHITKPIKFHHHYLSNITKTHRNTSRVVSFEHALKALEPRRDYPDWTTRPDGYAPCPGWPAKTRYNETHWREWHFRCFCYKYGELDPNCEIPYHYGWGNGQYDGEQGGAKCLKPTWWGCKEVEKPQRTPNSQKCGVAENGEVVCWQ